jgi:3-deoxy-D-manno-octulosonate 8-phosphate phosphatase (KDO 8-P phosphatase)
MLFYRKVKLEDLVFVLDVDGVMTTGQFFYSDSGKEYKIFGAHDNDGLKMLKDKLPIEFISADKRGFAIASKRIIDDMGFNLSLVSSEDRYNYLNEKYGLSRVIYMADGFYDANILANCLFGIAPQNARAEAKEAADYVTPSESAKGAVLDACLKIIKKFDC